MGSVNFLKGHLHNSDQKLNVLRQNGDSSKFTNTKCYQRCSISSGSPRNFKLVSTHQPHLQVLQSWPLITPRTLIPDNSTALASSRGLTSSPLCPPQHAVIPHHSQPPTSPACGTASGSQFASHSGFILPPLCLLVPASAITSLSGLRLNVDYLTKFQYK